jgi:hypothetical protein
MAPGGALAAVSQLPDVEVPFRLEGLTPWTGVWIEGQGPFRFEIATGSNFFAMWEPLALKLGLQRISQADATITLNFDWQYSNLFEAKKVLVGAGFELTRVSIAGFTGDRAPVNVGMMPLLPDRITTFDFQQGLMRSLRQSRPDTAGFVKAELIYNESYFAWTPLISCRLSGRPVRLQIDTGRGDSLMLLPDAVERLGLWSGSEPFYDRTQRAGAAELLQRTTRRGDLELGAIRLERPVITLMSPKTAILRNTDIDGYLGMEALRRLDLMIDQPRRALWARPNAVFSQAWRHDRAGFDMESNKEQRWVVTLVDPGSPAERAGLKVGDMLAATAADAGGKVLGGRFVPGPAKLSFGVMRAGVRWQIDIVLEDRV